MIIIGAALVALGFGILAAPLAIEAQPARVSRVGILTTGNPRSAPPANWESFRQGLRESGYVEASRDKTSPLNTDMRKASQSSSPTSQPSSSNSRLTSSSRGVRGR